MLLSEPYTRQLDGKLRELRFHLDARPVRITYWIATTRRIVLLTVFAKTRARERLEVERARDALKRCVEEAHTTDDGEGELLRRIRAVAPQMGVDFTIAALPAPADILVGEVTKVPNPRSGRLRTRSPRLRTRPSGAGTTHSAGLEPAAVGRGSRHDPICRGPLRGWRHDPDHPGPRTSRPSLRRRPRGQVGPSRLRRLTEHLRHGPLTPSPERETRTGSAADRKSGRRSHSDPALRGSTRVPAESALQGSDNEVLQPGGDNSHLADLASRDRDNEVVRVIIRWIEDHTVLRAEDVASQASRLLPSTRGWLAASECSNAAALVNTSG